LESCTVPQLPLPTPVVKLSSLGFGLTPQKPARVVVVVIGVVVVVTIVVVVAMGPVVVVVVVVVTIVVVVATGPVVVVVVVTSVVVVVAGGAVVVVVVVAGGAVVVVVAPPGGQGFGEQLPGPASCPPWALHSAGVRSIQVSKAPVADDCTQHWVCAGVVVVVVAPPVVVVVAAPVVVVAAGVVVVVVVLPGAPHASQQLDVEPTNAVPRRGASQSAASLLIEQVVSPWRLVRQQVTKPGRPQVDCAAQVTTASSHSGRSDPSSTAASATSSTQST